MKFISWNVNGLRSCVQVKYKKERDKSPLLDESGQPCVESEGFEAYFNQLDADFFCLQETKLQAGQIDLKFPGYESYWNYADKKGYSGTAIFTRHHPLNVNYGLDIDIHDHEGRVVTLEMEKFFLVCVYTPNSQETPKGENKPRRLPYRMQWEDDFQTYLHKLDARKPVIVCGDMNVAHEEIDIKNPSTNHHNAGFTDEERARMTELLDHGFTDSFRFLHPKDITYSWWSYRFHAREKNAGWRIDYFLVSDRLRPAMQEALIHTDIYGSDHCPVELDLDI